MSSGSVYISVHDGSYVGVIEDELVAFKTNYEDKENTISFGKATVATFDSLISYIERLKIHAIDWEKTNGAL